MDAVSLTIVERRRPMGLKMNKSGLDRLAAKCCFGQTAGIVEADALALLMLKLKDPGPIVSCCSYTRLGHGERNQRLIVYRSAKSPNPQCVVGFFKLPRVRKNRGGDRRLSEYVKIASEEWKLVDASFPADAFLVRKPVACRQRKAERYKSMFGEGVENARYIAVANTV